MPHHQRAVNGFTLIEVLMVVLLIGVLSGLALLSLRFDNHQRLIADETERLSLLIEEVASDALLQDQEYGLEILTDGYRFLCLDEKKSQWQACKNDRLRRHVFPDFIQLTAQYDQADEVAAQASSLTSSENQDDLIAGATVVKSTGEANSLLPSVLFLSSGESSPATLVLLDKSKTNDGHVMRLKIDDLGRVYSVDAEGLPLKTSATDEREAEK